MEHRAALDRRAAAVRPWAVSSSAHAGARPPAAPDRREGAPPRTRLRHGAAAASTLLDEQQPVQRYHIRTLEIYFLHSSLQLVGGSRESVRSRRSPQGRAARDTLLDNGARPVWPWQSNDLCVQSC